MRIFPIILYIFLISCNENEQFPIKEHEDLKKEMTENYKAHRLLFQKVAATVSKFKIIRAIEFEKGRDYTHRIEIYCDSLNRKFSDSTITIENLDDPKLIPILKTENITRQELKNLKSELDQLKCNSFFSFQQSNDMGKDYIHVQFRHNIWNGINFYYYKLFNRAMDSSMLNFFESHLVNLNQGEWKSKGGIIDSNAIWYYNNGF
jgi:hypothetical protein